MNNLLESITTNTVSGWTIDCNYGVWTQSWKNCQNWYGWGYENGDKVGSIITTLSGSGCARLDFGNCNTAGTVKAFLDEQEIGSADALIPHKVVEFNFNSGSELRISESDGVAVIQFNSLEIIDRPIVTYYPGNYSRVQKSIENFNFRPKMAIFRRAGMREGGLPLPLAFEYLIFLI